MNAMTATPAKLKDGSWGARVQGWVKAGDTVTVVTKSGKSWSARVERVVWAGDGVSLCKTASTSSSSSPPRTNRGTRTGCACGSVEEYSKDSDCWSCRHDA